MSIGVVVIVAGRLDHLRRTLGGLARQTRPPDDVVVVNMDGNGDVTDAVKRGPVCARTVLLGAGPAKLPLGAARNAGAGALATRRLVFLDVDCIPSAGLVDDYSQLLDRHPHALACGDVRYLRRRWEVEADEADDRSLGLWSAPHPARPPVTGGIRLDDHHELFWSLNFAVGRARWDQFGGFDEGFVGYGGEDTDLALRARSLGAPMAWPPGATAFHQWHPPTRHDPARLDEIVRNAHHFHRRWGTWPMVGWLRELAAAGTLTFDESSGPCVVET
ncbi:MAG: glycosyltransferase [Actinomycetota bacterium]|nr:glycosyltransferase [Actinomycetota bacterium]